MQHPKLVGGFAKRVSLCSVPGGAALCGSRLAEGFTHGELQEQPESRQYLQGNSIPWGHEQSPCQSLRLLLSFPLRGSWGLLLTPGCCFGRGQSSVSMQGGVTLPGYHDAVAQWRCYRGKCVASGLRSGRKPQFGGFGCPTRAIHFFGEILSAWLPPLETIGN